MNWFIPDFTAIGLITYFVGGFIRMYLIFVLGFTLKAQGNILHYPLFIFGFIYDVWLNWVFSLFPFFDLPAKWDETISKRMERYKKNKGGYRYDFAVWLCEKLDRHDKGHC